MGELIIHIGYPKTGSTAIQRFLTENGAKLFSDYGILYPVSGSFSDELNIRSHFTLASSLGIPPFTLGVKILKVWEHDYVSVIESLIRELKEMRPKSVVLSSEHFIFTRLSNLEKMIADLLGHLEGARVVFYLRRQDLFLESYYKQLIIDDAARFCGSPVQLIQQLKGVLDYWSFTTSLVEKLGEKNVKVTPLVYDRCDLINGDAISDFCMRVLNITSFSNGNGYTERRSLSAESALVLRFLNHFDIPYDVRKKIIALLAYCDELMGSRLKNILTLEQKLMILELYRESNELLFDEFFRTENRFQLSVQEIEELKDHGGFSRNTYESLKEGLRARFNALLSYLHASEEIFDEIAFVMNFLKFLSFDDERFLKFSDEIRGEFPDQSGNRCWRSLS